ncbi:signal transduction protein [Halobacteriales archaeon QS_8_69_26]|nr:MAG: signal transduction protein [Halobacteriales archaeon QS_8_69_26]
MNVSDVMTTRSEVVTVEVPGTRNDALAYLQERGFSSLPVIKRTDDGEEFRGIVTRESLIRRPDEDQLALLMVEVPSVDQATTIEELCELIVSRRERRIPVVDGRLEGIVTVTDVIRAVANGDIEGETAVEECATEDVNATYTETPLTVVEPEISYANVPYAVVLDDEADMAGIVTEVDIIDVARIVEGEAGTGDSIAGQDDDWKWEGIKAVGNRYLPTRNVEIPAAPVREFMTDDVVTVSTSTSLQDAAQLMIRHDVEQVPMVSGDDLVGIVRDVDVLEALYD